MEDTTGDMFFFYRYEMVFVFKPGEVCTCNGRCEEKSVVEGEEEEEYVPVILNICS